MTTPTTPDRITAAELRDAFQSLSERLDQIEASLVTLRDGLASAASSQPLSSAPLGTGQLVEFAATQILVGVDDNGAYTYKAKGGQYMKFGVRIWPETLPVIGVDPDQLKPGPNACALKLVALMGEKGPRKVIGLAK